MIFDKLKNGLGKDKGADDSETMLVWQQCTFYVSFCNRFFAPSFPLTVMS